MNFDVPQSPDDYIHRVGRTARMEAVGDAVSFASPEEQSDLAAIERAVGARIARLVLPGLDDSAHLTERPERVPRTRTHQFARPARFGRR